MADNLQSRLFEVLGSPCLKAALEGYNATVFAYGQTGSGKTYTMMGDGTSAGRGMVPRIASALLQRMSYLYHGDPECHIQVSFLEIYQEKIRDLLTSKHPGHSGTSASEPFTSPARSQQQLPVEESANKESDMSGFLQSQAQHLKDHNASCPQPPKKAKHSTENAPPSPASPRTPASPRSPRSPRSPSISPISSPNGGQEKLKIREHPKLGPYVVGLTRRFVTSWEEMKDALTEGQSNRTFGATDMNQKSSRSHTVFTMTITQKVKGQDGLDSQRTSQLNMVDLAGSERQARTHASGQRLKESGYINRSLSLLNNVITQLSQGSDFVPYRNSVLTWLLKESLGGNSKTVMIANISPAFEDLRETLSTLRYANRAKRIQNKPTINEDPKDLTIRCLMSEVKTLRKMVESLALRASFHPSVRLRSVGVQVPESPQQMESCLAIKLPQKRDSFAFREPSSAPLALPFTPLFPNPFPKPHVLTIPGSQSEPVMKRRSSAIERALSFGITSQVVQKSAASEENSRSMLVSGDTVTPPLLLKQVNSTGRTDNEKPFIFGELPAVKLAAAANAPNTLTALECQTDSLIKKLTNVLKKPGIMSNSTKSINPESTKASYPYFVQLSPSDDDTSSDTTTGVQHILQPGVTKVGSSNGADILVPGLLEEHCEVLHIPGRLNGSGHKTTTRVSILIYGNALASVDGRPLQRYAVLEHGCKLKLGGGKGAIIFHFFDPSKEAP
ncbi:hypothetical protein CLOM_g15440 [Closterium sp. NIES-68]|nr:hypothetical protein CLOM_g15440 [Closterium sp. NIES-68]GJP67707.1 hypothetical protein CLOP_g24495 [Closterium sp. NIES-67]